MESSDESAPVIISLAGNQAVRVPLTVCVEKTKAAAKAMDDHNYERAVLLRGHTFQRNLNTYLELSKLHPKLVELPKHVFTIGVLNIGAPACGVNAAVRSIVRHVLWKGHRVLLVYDGWVGFLNGTVKEAEWMNVHGWSGVGGSKLGTQKVDAKHAGLEDIANQIKKFKINALIIVGGFEGYLSVIQLYENRALHPEFCIPVLLVPATISNNIPGTDFSVGTDTALNEIIVTCDKMKQSAQGSKRRIFIVETMGGNCGYLATLAGLASGADQAYIKEEPYNIFDIVSDADHLKKKMLSDMKRGIVLRSELSNPNFNTDFILRLFQEHGRGTFSARANILGHAQQGGCPSPFDRSFAFRLGAKASNIVLEMLNNNKDDQGRAVVTDPCSCGVVGLTKRTIDVTPVEVLKECTDFNLRLSYDPWWLKLRPLLRILAKHESVYVADINESG
ncbi:hypothetical protein ACOME3_005232 [Neoechinorhynchus agilis]